ncbi:MAG: DUF1501 domain-containing protein [Planctomycetes bacterium]|nr:DUF1501 domain-containing protein [Planctomycetota bacterium]
MLELTGRPVRFCDGLSRRTFVRAGFLGLAGLSLPDVLRLRAQAATPGATRKDTAVIMFWLDGGPTHMDTYDLKPDAPAEYRGTFQPIRTNVPGIHVCELLPQHAKVMDRLAILRSVHHKNGDHFAAAHWMLTGYHGSTAADLPPKYPGVGAITAKLRGPNRPGVPAFVGVPSIHSVGLAPGYHGAAYLGVGYNPLEAGGDPNNAGYQVPNLQLLPGVDMGRLDDRRSLLSSFDRIRREVDRSGLMNGMDQFNQQAFEMVTGDAARRAFDINREDPRIRDRYGRHTWGQSALLARRLVETGVTFVTITASGWDDHAQVANAMRAKLPPFDRALGALVEDLSSRGMVDQVAVVVMGEFGRTPRINPGAGRDHWGEVMSVLIGGGGLRGGQVVGSSNSKGEVPKDRPLSPADVLHTLYHVLGIDPTIQFNNPAGRPISILNDGSVIPELV